MTRKSNTWNTALTAIAKREGTYGTLLDRWTLVTPLRKAGVTPEEAYTRVLGVVADLAPEQPAKPAKVGPVVTDKAERKARLTAPAPQPTLADDIRLVVENSNDVARVLDRRFGQGYCGGVRLTVYIDGRTKVAKALREAGFFRAGTGEYVSHVCAAQNLSANEMAAEDAVSDLKILMPEAKVYASSYSD